MMIGDDAHIAQIAATSDTDLLDVQAADSRTAAR